MKIEDAVMQQVAKEAFKKINIDALSDRIAPQLAKGIEQRVINVVLDSDDVYEIILDAFRSPQFRKMIKTKIASIFSGV